MAVTADQVLVKMTADTSQYRQSMDFAARSATQFDLKSTTAMANLGASFKALGASSLKMSQEVHRSLNSMAQNRGTVRLEQSIDSAIGKMREAQREAIRTKNSLENITSGQMLDPIPQLPRATQRVHEFNHNVGNMAAQLQDIGVTAAGGMNPLLIALQQGTQISAILAGSQTGGLRAVGAAFKSVISPASLVTLAIVGGAAALIQWAVGAVQAARGTGDFEKELKSLQDLTELYVDSVDDAAIGINNLKSQYGELADEVAAASREMVFLTSVQAKAAAISSTQSLSRQLGINLNPVEAPVEWGGNVNQDRARVLNQAYLDSMEQLRKKTQATTEQTDRLRMALNRTDSSNSLEAIVKDGQNLLDVIGELSSNRGADQDFLIDWANRVASVMKVAQDQIAATKKLENDLLEAYVGNTQKLKSLVDDRENAEKLLLEATRANNRERMDLFQEVLDAIDREIRATKQLARESDTAYMAMTRAYSEYADSRKAGNEWANSPGGFEAQYVAARAAGAGSQEEELVRAVSALAEKMGLAAEDLLAVMSFETGGKLRPDTMGPVTGQGQHFGLIQFGDKGAGPRYGVTPESSITEQVIAAGRYLQDAGVKAGDNLASIYAAVLSGDARKIHASDLAAGGVVGDVTEATGGSQFASHKARAQGLLAAYGGAAQQGKEDQKDITDSLREEVRERERLAKQIKEYGEELERTLVTEERRAEIEDHRSAQENAIKALNLSRDEERKALAAVNAEAEKQLTISALLEEAKKRQVNLDARMINSTLTYRQAIEALGEQKKQSVLNSEQMAVSEQQLALRTEFAREQQDAFKQGLIQSLAAGESFRQVLGRIALAYAEAYAEAALFNSGPMSSGGGGGFFGGLLGILGGGDRLTGALRGAGLNASFEGGGFTGYGSRSGGIDGRGGFPAILHPNETVIDHTKGQRAGGGSMTISVNVAGARGNAEIEDMVRSGVMQGLGEYDRRLPGRVRQVNSDNSQRYD